MNLRLGKLPVTAAGAILLEPLLNFFAPSIKPLVQQLVQSDEAQKLLQSIAKSAGEAGSGVFIEFLAGNTERLLDALTKAPKLDEALVVALRQTFANMNADLRKRNQHNVLITFNQFFEDWDEKLEEIQVNDFLWREFLEVDQFARLFYEQSGVENRAWWQPVKSKLKTWTKDQSIPSELERYLNENLVFFANEALIGTLNREPYKEAWNEFHTSIGTQILSTLDAFDEHLTKLINLASVAAGQFVRETRSIDFNMRKPIDDLVEELATKEIYIQREVLIADQQNIRIRSLIDIAEKDGYFLLAAPAGSGKSTLMAHWIRNITSSSRTKSATSEPKICYHFYSKQNGTSDHDKGLAILSDQLLKAHNIHANVNSLNPATIDSIIRNALALDNPKRLVLIIDGLDEAGDPSNVRDFFGLFKPVLPSSLGKNTTVILTVRDDEGVNSLNSYRDRLGLPLNALTLPTVGIDEFGSYLSQTKDGKLSKKRQDADFLKAIIAKTEGLAIYIHYLLDELSRTEQVQWANVIAGKPRGFKEYVRMSLPTALINAFHWKDALSFISLAQTPLYKRDLIALTRLSGNRLGEIEMDGVSWQIKRWLRKEGDTWSFSHHKIGEVFYELYVLGERENYMKLLLAYCADWEQHRSVYVLHHYPVHLFQEKVWNDLFNIARNQDFLMAQTNAFSDEPEISLKTLQTALQGALEADDAKAIADFSIRHARRALKIESESPLSALTAGNLERAINLAELKFVKDRERGALWYLYLVRELKKRGQEMSAQKILADSSRKELPRLTENGFEVLAVIALIAVSDVDAEAFFKLQQALLTDRRRELLLSNLINQNRLELALRVARETQEATWRAMFLAAIARAQSHNGLKAESARTIDEALSSARQISYFWHFRVEAFVSIAQAQILNDFPDAARKTLNEAWKNARQIELMDLKGDDQELHDDVFFQIAMTQASNGQYDEAVGTLQAIWSNNKKAEALALIAQSQAKTGLEVEAKQTFANALETAQSNRAEYPSIEPSSLLATVQARNGQYSEAVNTAQKITDPRARVETLLMIARTQNAGGFNTEPQEIISITRKIAPEVLGYKLTYTLKMIAQAQVEVGQYDEALTTAREIENKIERIETLAMIGLSQTANGFVADAELVFNEALMTAREIEDENDSLNAFAAIVQMQAQSGLEGEMGQSLNGALGGSRKIDCNYERAAVLAVLAALQSDNGLAAEAEQILANALTVARGIEDETKRAEALTEIARINTKQYGEALAVTRKIEAEWDRANALTTIAQAQAYNGQHIQANETAKEIEYEGYRAEALMKLSQAQSTHGHYAEAIESAKKIVTSEHSRAQALKTLGQKQASNGLIAEALQSFTEALEATRQITLFDKDDWDQMEDESLLLQVLSLTLRARADSRFYIEALETARKIDFKYDRAEAQGFIAIEQAINGLYKEALKTAHDIKDGMGRAETLARIAQAQIRDGFQFEAEQSFREAEVIAREIKDEERRTKALVTIAETQINVGFHENAWRTSQSILYQRNQYLPDIAAILVEQADKKEFNRFVIPCAYYEDAAYRMIGLMAHLYSKEPEQLNRMAEVVAMPLSS